MKRTIDVRIELVIDTEAWTAEYGSDDPINDSEDYILGQLTGSPAAEAGCFTVEGFTYYARREPGGGIRA